MNIGLNLSWDHGKISPLPCKYILTYRAVFVNGNMGKKKKILIFYAKRFGEKNLFPKGEVYLEKTADILYNRNV